MKNTIVIFGAGNIGRSFLAPVFSQGDYDVVFADVSPGILDALAHRNSYRLVEKSDQGETSTLVGPVRGIDARDSQAVRREIETASLCATCVGGAALPSVLRMIAETIVPRNTPLDIILAENLANAGDLARWTLLQKGLPSDYLERRIGIVESSIGKMVPIMPKEVVDHDPLEVWAEEYKTLIVDAEGFKGPVPRLPHLQAVSPITAWVARKLYIHNFGHAATAYLGHQSSPEAKMLWEVLQDRILHEKVRHAMKLSGEALRREYPGVFREADIENHVDDLLYRFANRALGDTIYRVGRDLGRKLSRKDRIVGPLELAWKHGLDTAPFLEILDAARQFLPRDPSGKIAEKERRIVNLAHRREEFIEEVLGIHRNNDGELFEHIRKELAVIPFR